MNKTMKLITSMALIFLSANCFAAGDTTVFAHNILWAIPFIGILLSIAIFPLVAPDFWHHHFGKIVAAWALSFAIPAVSAIGISGLGHLTVHALLAEYIPFIVLVGSLYIISGGVFVKGNIHGTPLTNTIILLIGTLLASVMGTTGAAMLLIRPLIRANDNRQHKAHVIVFFIFLVANIGGSLTPLGDPPLFLGFLKGVPFFWTATHIWWDTLFCSVVLLAVFFALDSYYFHRREEELPAIADPTPDSKHISLEGKINFLFLLGAIGFVLLSGMWKSDVSFDIYGTHLALPSLVRDLGLMTMAGLSLTFTGKWIRTLNQFNYGPIEEVAKLFAGIFLTIAPVIAMLQAGAHGPFAGLVAAVHDASGAPIDARYFWATGLLSGFLDNAPTYLVFFNLAGGDVVELTTKLATTLAAISAGSVFMGALSYIGNAPNFMVKAIAEQNNVKMPSFFGYMAWSFGILVPLFILVTVLFF